MIWPLIIISYASLFVFGITDNVRGPLFPEILKEFAVNDSMGSMMFAVSSLSGLIVSIIVMYLVRHFDRKKILQLGCFVLMFVLWGLAFTKSFFWFVFLNMCFGLASGIIGFIPNVLVPLGSTNERKQQFMSGLHAMYGISSLLAPLIVALIGHYFGNWRASFLVVSLAPIALLFYSFHPVHTPHHKKEIVTHEERKAKKKKNFLPQVHLATMLSFCVIAEVMMSSRMALFMQRQFHSGIEESSLYTTYFFIALLGGRLLFALIKLPQSIRWQLNMCAIVTGFLIFSGIKWHPIGLVLAGFSVAPFYPLSASLISNEFPDDMDRAISFVIGIDSLMLAFMHLFIGKMTDLYGINNAMLFGIIFLLISLSFVNSYDFIYKKNHK